MIQRPIKTRLGAIRILRKRGEISCTTRGLEYINGEVHDLKLTIIKGKCPCDMCEGMLGWRRKRGGVHVRFDTNGTHHPYYVHNLTARQVLSFIKRHFHKR